MTDSLVFKAHPTLSLLSSPCHLKQEGCFAIVDHQTNIRGWMNILILWFPQFNEELKHIRGVFEQYDEDVNGSIDLEELKKCLQKLTLTLKEEEVEDLFHSCDIDNSMSSMFIEVIYLLVEHSSSPPKSIHLKLDFIFIHMFDLKTSTYCDHPYMMA
ncbi:probable calcium-binding protein CML22 [Populus nigra]|uniref:probable calcium-binding protein CML22 n=1 Tax=Populus nigra TaxID=3691 RepID=UPI002B2695D4|nr:probable calcium-binding protein CML22 [Populus nigra]